MYPVDDLFAAYARSFEAHREAEMTLPEYLEASRDDAMLYASGTERLLAAIGEPEMVDTAKDAPLGRIFMNRTMRVYPAFSEFYSMEETIERIVGFLRHASHQDISSLVGKVDIRKLELPSQNDPAAYSYSGGLNRTNQGILEFVEKVPYCLIPSIGRQRGNVASRAPPTH
jgi:predicted Ser/Thr protein kinase